MRLDVDELRWGLDSLTSKALAMQYQEPFPKLFQAYPTLEAWVAANPADMAGPLLDDLAAIGGLSAHNLKSTFEQAISRNGMPDWKERTGPILEAYAWLGAHGLLAPSPSDPMNFDVVTRRGREIIRSRSFDHFVRSEVSLYSALDIRISQKVWSIYLKGDYDIAIAYAFKVVEVRMRERAQLDKSYFSERLIKNFFQRFAPPEGRLGTGLSPTEYLMIGAFGRYRNEAAHELARIDDVAERWNCCFWQIIACASSTS